MFNVPEFLLFHFDCRSSQIELNISFPCLNNTDALQQTKLSFFFFFTSNLRGPWKLQSVTARISGTSPWRLLHCNTTRSSGVHGWAPVCVCVCKSAAWWWGFEKVDSCVVLCFCWEKTTCLPSFRPALQKRGLSSFFPRFFEFILSTSTEVASPVKSL